jgi:SAM-dependent methyltransferase/uncharacterized protein YbaR (Trm112 family)
LTLIIEVSAQPIAPPRSLIYPAPVSADWFHALLACPRHRTPLRRDADELVCARGDRFPLIDGVAVLLTDDLPLTHPGWWMTPEQLAVARVAPDALDPDPKVFVRSMITATCGNLYQDLSGELRYPIPELRLPRGDGARFLDIGGNWGRWSIAAARAGYRVVCADPSLRAALVGRRIAKELGVEVAYVVADARRLPLQDDTIDLSFSYSVLQHLSVAHVRESLREIARVTRPGGLVRVQMPNVLAPRQAFNYARMTAQEWTHWLRHREKPERWMFYVRPWTLRALRREFTRAIGPARVFSEGFFSLNAQLADVDMLPPRRAAIVRASELLRKLSTRLPALTHLADSVHVEAIKREQ